MVWRLFRADAAHNRKRIALTVLAIAWGTLSIVMLLSFGEGMKRAFHRTVRGMGEGIGVLWPGATTRAWAGLNSGRQIQFTDEDMELLRARIPELAAISREYSRRVPVSLGAKSINARVRGVDPSFGPMRNLIPSAGGRFIDEADLTEKRRVVFLGDELAKDLFGTADPIGRTVQINQSTFLVVGVMQAKVMMGMYSGPDKGQATIPATTFKSMYTDARPGNMVYAPVSMAAGDQAKSEIYRVLGKKYRFVGGMGVANIMYAVVKERTREIGVKMALGAKVRQVMAPFVMEALMMTVMGGVLGTAVSLGLMAVISVLPLKGEAFEFLGRPTFSPAIALSTSVVLGTIGMLAGYFPARRAASVNPAVSLRYE